MRTATPIAMAIALVGIWFAGANDAEADDPDEIEVRTGDVVVTATRFAEPAGTPTIGTQIISGDEIRGSGARSLPEYLGQRSGIYSRDNFGSPNQQIDLRGFGITGDQNTLILVDGQRISENEQIPADLASVPLTSIERIEIVRGSGAVLYGGGTTGGTINIITKGAQAGERAGLVRAGYGSYATSELAAAARFGADRVGVTVNYNRYDSDNYRDNNELQQRNFQSDFRVFGARGPVYLKLGSGDQELRLPGARTEAQLSTDRRGTDTPDDYGTLQTTRMNLGTNLVFDNMEAAVDITHRKREAFAFNNPGSTQTEGKDVAISPRIKVAFSLGVAHELVAGIDYDDWEYSTSTVFPPFAPSALNSTQTNTALFIKDSLSFGAATRVSLGGRIQRSETTISDLTGGSPEKTQKRDLEAWELAFRQGLGHDVSLYAKVGRSFRVANVDDNRFVADPLEPQTSDDSEIGVDLASRKGYLRAAAYRMNIKNEIAFLPSDLLPPFGGNVNLPPTQREGFEVEARWITADWLTLAGQYTYTLARFEEGLFGGVDVSGNTVPLVPRHRAGLSATVIAMPRLTLTGIVSYVGEQYYDNDQSNSFGRQMPEYVVTDLTASYAVQRWQFQAAVRNLFNEHYYSYAIRSTSQPTFNAYPAAERSLLVSAQYRF